MPVNSRTTSSQFAGRGRADEDALAAQLFGDPPEELSRFLRTPFQLVEVLAHRHAHRFRERHPGQFTLRLGDPDPAGQRDEIRAQRRVGERVKFILGRRDLRLEVAQVPLRDVAAIARNREDHRQALALRTAERHAGLRAEPRMRLREALEPELHLQCAAREEGKLPGGSRGVDDAERGLHVKLIEPTIDAAAPGNIDLGEVERRIAVEPFGQKIEAVLLDQRDRVGFVDRVLEEQRHQIFERIDRADVDPLRMRLQRLQQRFLLGKAPSRALELERLGLATLHAEQLVPATVD